MIRKFSLMVILLLLVPTLSIAQEKAKREPATKLEQFLSKKGKLIIKDFRKIGVISGQYGTKIKIDALTIYEPSSEFQKIKGLRVEIQGAGKFETTRTSFLDMDEVESLSQAISYMIRLLEKWKDYSREYTEVIFSTRGDFDLGFYQKGTSVQGFAQSGVIGASTCYFPTSEFLSIKNLIDKGISLLKE
ncbi:MAG: hypothetical protein Q6368_004580 [Candidatus Baldrarchaeota archaeon]